MPEKPGWEVIAPVCLSTVTTGKAVPHWVPPPSPPPAPPKPTTASTRSPTLIRVPTPEIWSTRTDWARRPLGRSGPGATPTPETANIVWVIWAPDTTLVRTIWPTICEGSPMASLARSSTLMSFVVIMSARIWVPSGMSTVATTVGNCSGGLLLVLPLEPELNKAMIATNATAARTMPTSRIRRLDRFKATLPSRVTGGTTVAPPKGGATIPKG